MPAGQRSPWARPDTKHHTFYAMGTRDMNDTRDIYAYLVALHGFDPIGEAEVVAEAEALTGGAA